MFTSFWYVILALLEILPKYGLKRTTKIEKNKTIKWVSSLHDFLKQFWMKILLGKFSRFKTPMKYKLKIYFMFLEYFLYFFSGMFPYKSTCFWDCRRQNEIRAFHFCDFALLERVLRDIRRVYELLHTTIWQTWACQG